MDEKSITIEESLKNFRANSIGRMDIIIETMEDLQLKVPLVEFGTLKIFKELLTFCLKKGCMLKMNNVKKDVAITGIGVISSIGNNIGELNKSLKNGICCISKLENMLTPEIPVNIGAQIKRFSFEANLTE